jgi:glutamate/tyrosine decarboxylase-like PLP-dependent enzyme/GNAT superfamily N-acetyltransferase
MDEVIDQGLQIRQADPSDGPAIESVLRVAFAEYEFLYTPAAFAATTPAADELRRRLDEGPTWIALLHRTVVGTVSAVLRGEALYIRSMAVVPTVRERGVGTLLLEHAERYARERGVVRLELSTTPFLTEAIALYKRLGFQASNDGPCELSGTPLFTMTKALASESRGLLSNALDDQSAGHSMPDDVLKVAVELAQSYLAGLNRRPVGGTADVPALQAALGGPLPEDGSDAVKVVRDLARTVDAGLVASAGPRFFGFVTGGTLPAALAADWLTTVWDQNAGLYIESPAASVVETVVAAWLLELFGLTATASVGFVTGGQMANFTCLAAARHAMLLTRGWDVEDLGLSGAPPVNVVVSADAHVTLLTSLQMLGLGAGRALRVPTDLQGRIRPAELRRVLATCQGPTIVCAQAGEVNTGSFDLFGELAVISREHEAWLHVDGAFGLWAAASPKRRDLVTGVSFADSWATDAHKVLNTPYDAGIAIVRSADAHRAAMSRSVAYLPAGGSGRRDSCDYTPESSRRARAFSIYAAMRYLGRRGLGQLVDHFCDLARLMASLLRTAPNVDILNDVVFNQVLVRFRPPVGARAGAFTDRVIAAVQEEGTCWLGGTTWRGERAMRISVCNWSTTASDIQQSAESILRSARGLGGA